MACAQMSSLSSTEGRLLEGEKGLAYWCMSTIQYSISFSFLFHYLSKLFPFLPLQFHL